MDSAYRYTLEKREKWRDIMNRIPFIQFPNNWQVQITPPCGGAVVRFRVKRFNIKPDEPEDISIYLDWFGRLGCVQEPYWEIFPDKDGNNLRFLLNETDEMLKAIQESLDS